MNGFKQLKKLASLALMLCIAFQLQAADVDLAKAKNVAKSFMAKQVANGRLRASATSNLKLAKAEPSTFKPDAVDYYIFNADKSYVIVSGDDQAPEILMYGEEGRVDLNNVPPSMQWLLNKYKYQIDGLKAGTLKPNGYTPKATTAVAPLTNANWDQSTPYNNQCPTSGSSRTLTGCPATSLSMCYYVWKWPKTFPAVAAINGSSSGGVSAAALPERTADWDNIIDEYTGPTNKESSNEQKTAVAWLMRYAGQSIPDYMYGTSASGANDPEIYQGVLNMGYTDAKLYTLTELQSSGWGYTNGPQQYTDAQWNEWMLAELHAGNPIEYLAYDCSSYQPAGHAFNVFGCNTSGQYYVNWGWSGDSNGYCTLHNFTTNTGATGQSGTYVFKYGEAMIIGIRPPAGALGPQITVNPTELSFEGYVGTSYTKTFTVTGANLEGDITISKQGSNDFTVSPTTITAANAANGVQVTVTYKPTAVGSGNATLTLSSTNAESVTVTLTGNGKPIVPELIADPESLSFRTALGESQTKSISVLGANLEGDVTIDLTDQAGVFSVDKTTISKSEAEEGAEFNVTFSSEAEGTFNGTILLTSPNLNDQVTITLTASANDGGTASDPYLNIAKYATIDDAGNNVSGMSTIYKYTEYPNDACAWLTVSNYGAHQDDANQNWLNCEGTAKSGNENWNASDIFLGSSNYFTGTAYYANWNEAYENYYVTNCSQVKQYAFNIQSSYSQGNVYPMKMEIYECTLNADGTLTVGTTSVDYKESTTTNAGEVVSSINLDPSKIYKVRIYNDYSHLYEIGFKTPIQGIKTPVAIDATEVGTNSFTANWNACEGATSYTLRVMPKPEITTELLLTETFANCTKEDSNADFTDYTDNAGWDGTRVYIHTGGLRLGSGSGAGTLTSPALDLTNSNGKVSIKFKVKTYNNDTNCNLKISCGSSSNTLTIPNSTETEYTQVLDCTAAAGQNVTFATTAKNKRVVLTNVEIYSGDITATAVTAPAVKAEGEMLFPGITDTHYTVTNLEPATTYIYDVKAVYGNKESNWSNQIEVTTLPVTDITLAELVALGEAADGKAYRISDCLLGVYQKDNIIWFKDEVEKTIVLKNETLTVIGGAVDFNEPGDEMNYWIDDIRSKDFDQSNWIEVVFPDAKDYTTEIYTKNLTGVYSYNNGNPKLVITKSVADEDQIDLGSYNPNHYIPANFVGSQNGYFLSIPKAQEYAYFTKAKWDGEKMVMTTDASSNPEGFTGSFVIMPVDGLDANTNVGKFYSFNGIVRKTAVSQSPRIKSNQGGYVVETINLNPDNGTVTAISTVGVNGEVKSVKYVNVAGVVSDRPFKGVNIVVTEYSDGSRTTAKVVK